MEGKNVILSVLIMSLVMAQIHVEAKKSCCKTTTARNCYNACRLVSSYKETCAKQCGCTLVDKRPCPNGWIIGSMFENSGDAKKEYCKLGCALSVCDAMVTLQNINANEIVNGAVEQCGKACSTFCTNGNETAVETS